MPSERVVKRYFYFLALALCSTNIAACNSEEDDFICSDNFKKYYAYIYGGGSESFESNYLFIQNSVDVKYSYNIINTEKNSYEDLQNIFYQKTNRKIGAYVKICGKIYNKNDAELTKSGFISINKIYIIKEIDMNDMINSWENENISPLPDFHTN